MIDFTGATVFSNRNVVRSVQHGLGLNSPTDGKLEGTSMPVMVRIPTPLRSLTKGTAEVQAKGDTVDDLVKDLERQFPGLRDRLMDEKGELRRFINLYVNEEDVRFLQGRSTSLKDGDTVSIVPAIAGGR